MVQTGALGRTFDLFENKFTLNVTIWHGGQNMNESKAENISFPSKYMYMHDYWVKRKNRMRVKNV